MTARMVTWLAAAALLFAAAAGVARAAPPDSPWGADYFPDVELTTHEGKKVRFYQDLIENKQVVVSFIFTSCKVQCPLITANLARVARKLGDRMGKDLHFVSVSLDPEVDTPEVLAKYAKQFGAGRGWTFVTGAEEDIDLVKKKMGEIWDVKEQHQGLVNVGNDLTGNWMRVGAKDDPTYLAMVIGDWLDPNWAQRAPGRTYAEAPQVVAKPSLGQKTFNDKCASCHDIGKGKVVGPDLAGVVARRGERWLTRWLAAPDKMIREKDPVALEMVKKHDGLEMPNLQLRKDEVKALVDLLKTKERKLAAAHRAPGADPSARAP